LTFHAVAVESGTLVFTWRDQNNETWTEDATIEVT